MALLRATLDVLVRQILSWGPMHAFGNVSWLDDRSGRILEVQDAALVQSLHGVEERELLSVERATSAGKAYLRAESAKLRTGDGYAGC